MKYAASWSGGKDSALAAYRAIQSGLRVTTIVNLIAADTGRVRFHGVEARMIREQAALAGMELLQKPTTADGYEEEFKEAVGPLKDNGTHGMVFGDIYVDEHRQWVQRVTGEVGLKALEPLWGEDTGALFNEFLDSGFEAVVTCVQGGKVGSEWVGRKLSRKFLDYLKAEGRADPCGEQGEYHTFVTAGPLFGSGRIEITESEVVRRDGYYFLDIRDYKIIKEEV